MRFYLRAAATIWCDSKMLSSNNLRASVKVPGAGLAGLFDFSCPGVQDRLVEVAQSRDLDAFLAWNLPDVRVVLAADTRQARRMVSLGPAGANCLRQVYPPSG